MSIELPLNTSVGKGLRIEHGTSLVINYKSIIGDYVTLKHCVTIGCKTDYKNHCISNSIIGNNVVVNPHSCVIGVKIGDNCIIGAGSIVTKDFSSNTVIAGNPARNINTSKG